MTQEEYNMRINWKYLFQKTLFAACAAVAIQASAQTQHEVPMTGNAYVTNHADHTRITDEGIKRWTSPQTVVSAYFYVSQPQTITLALKGSGHASMLMTCNGAQQTVHFDSEEPKVEGSLSVNVPHAGYVKVDLQGVERTGANFADITDIMVTLQDTSLREPQDKQGSGQAQSVTCVKDFSNYWGRRGPSVHMAYQLPKDEDIEWFYNEVTVPAEGETMYSYYMAAGFGEGYFGMQYNSPTERRVLFSVWSPFDTQDPRDIPEDQRVKLLKSGPDVHIGEFGNEGSGGQSYLRYPWKVGETYSFLMRVHPDGKGNTIYTAFFYAPPSTDSGQAQGKWRLIAKFLRPQTDTWYTHAHSFLENFMPEQGYLSRCVRFSNQWARTRSGRWVRPEAAIFTNDGTARAGVRLDYAGGVAPDGQALFLKMGGFFDENVLGGTSFPLPAYEGRKAPKVNFKKLQKLEK